MRVISLDVDRQLIVEPWQYWQIVSSVSRDLVLDPALVTYIQRL
jgi:hypothetical protein